MPRSDSRPVRLNRRGLLKAGLAATAALGAAALPGLSLANTAGSHGMIEPAAGAWKTWALPGGSALRLPPPPDSHGEIGQVRGMLGRLGGAMLDRVAYWDAGSPAYRWNELANQMSFDGTFGALNFGRIQAYLNIALYDATVAAWDSKYAHSRLRPSELDPSLVPAVAVPRSPAYPSEHAVTAGAAAEVLAYFAPKEADALRQKAAEAADSRVWAGVQYPSDAAAGLDLGRRVAPFVIEMAKRDHYDTARWDGQMPEGPGLWKGQNPMGVADRFWKPLLVPSADALRPPPPPAHDSPERAREVEEVRSFPRTAFTNSFSIHVAYAIRGGPNANVRWNRELSQRIAEEHLEDNPWAARSYALLHAVYHDAWITTQDAKFAFWTARPTQFDPAIKTTIPVPNHPSYPSNAAAVNTSPALVLGYLFPRDAAALKKAADEIGDSRLWAGVHFRSDVEVSRRMGEQLAKIALDWDRSF
ncbi:MAG TPA: phosphatase PAP2 family protein [Chloroflexota bacterium]|jgi:membrane-associated phospholipid phosphatase